MGIRRRSRVTLHRDGSLPFTPVPSRDLPMAERPTLDRMLNAGKISVVEAQGQDFGYDPWPVHGLLTAQTRTALQAFQARYG